MSTIRPLRATAPTCDFTAASASRANVLSAIALASPGQTVCVPAGTADWTGGITVSGINLVGPGKSAGSPCIITGGLVTVTKHASQRSRLTGFRFTGTDQHLSVDGSAANQFFQVNDNHFNVVGAPVAAISTNGGLFKVNTWTAPTPTSADVFAANLGTTNGPIEWLAATSMGTEDAAGTKNIYFEDDVFTNILETALDADEGSRPVFRHCTFQDSSIVCHAGGSGTSENDTSLVGYRHIEIYNCNFRRVDTSALSAMNKWIWLRGASGVIANNDFDLNSTSEYPGKPHIQLGVGCEVSGYPIRYQIGQTTDTADATPDKPLLIFGNTGAGAAAGNFIDLRGNDTGGGGHTCGTPGTFIQSGRDYQLSNTWGWTPLAYPHPLAV